MLLFDEVSTKRNMRNSENRHGRYIHNKNDSKCLILHTSDGLFYTCFQYTCSQQSNREVQERRMSWMLKVMPNSRHWNQREMYRSAFPLQLAPPANYFVITSTLGNQSVYDMTASKIFSYKPGVGSCRGRCSPCWLKDLQSA